MRLFWGLMVGCALLLSGTAWAEPVGSPSSPMKALFEEMKAQAQTESAYREDKKKELQAIESQIDAMRTDAKAMGATKDPDTVKLLQLKRLAILEEVAHRDIDTAEKSMEFARRKLDIAKLNLAAFQKKKAEAEKSIGA